MKIPKLPPSDSWWVQTLLKLLIEAISRKIVGGRMLLSNFVLGKDKQQDPPDKGSA